MKKLILALATILLIGSASAFALMDFSSQRIPVVFYAGHSHDENGTNGAPQHSGGTDIYGCHNRSVPYHCH